MINYYENLLKFNKVSQKKMIIKSTEKFYFIEIFANTFFLLCLLFIVIIYTNNNNNHNNNNNDNNKNVILLLIVSIKS